MLCDRLLVDDRRVGAVLSVMEEHCGVFDMIEQTGVVLGPQARRRVGCRFWCVQKEASQLLL